MRSFVLKDCGFSTFMARSTSVWRLVFVYVRKYQSQTACVFIIQQRDEVVTPHITAVAEGMIASDPLLRWTKAQLISRSCLALRERNTPRILCTCRTRRLTGSRLFDGVILSNSPTKYSKINGNHW